MQCSAGPGPRRRRWTWLSMTPTLSGHTIYNLQWWAVPSVCPDSIQGKFMHFLYWTIYCCKIFSPLLLYSDQWCVWHYCRDDWSHYWWSDDWSHTWWHDQSWTWCAVLWPRPLWPCWTWSWYHPMLRGLDVDLVSVVQACHSYDSWGLALGMSGLKYRYKTINIWIISNCILSWPHSTLLWLWWPNVWLCLQTCPGVWCPDVALLDLDQPTLTRVPEPVWTRVPRHVYLMIDVCILHHSTLHWEC